MKPLVAFVLFMLMLTTTSATTTFAVSHDDLEFVPMEINTTEFRVFDMVKSRDGVQRRRLEPYQLCLVCKCCGGTTCSTMPCCFGIDCQLPGKPFGVCAFVPKVCNCIGCTSSTSSSSTQSSNTHP